MIERNGYTLDNAPTTYHDGIKQQYVMDWLME